MELLIAYFGTIGILVVFLGFIAGRNADEVPNATRDVWGEYCLQMLTHMRGGILVMAVPPGKVGHAILSAAIGTPVAA